MTIGVTDCLDTPMARARNRAGWRRHVGTGVDIDQVVAELSAGSLPDAFAGAAAANPQRIALDVGGATITYRELLGCATAAADILAADGARNDRPVLLVLPTSIELVVAYVACLWLGIPVTFVSPASTTTELDQVVDRTAADVAVASGEAARHLQPMLRRVLAPEDLPPGGGIATRRSVAGSDTTAILAFTSGTTGRPKAVPLTHANLLASIRGVLRAWRWTGDDVLVHTLPLLHQHGLTGLQASLIAGGTAVVLPDFDADALCAAIVEHKATVLFAVPAVWERLVQAHVFATTDVSSLRLATSGSAPLPPALAQRVAAVLGAPPLERYGLTESGLDVSNLYDGERRIGSVGWPLPGVEVSVATPEGDPMPDGEDGEVVLRGPQVFAGYADAADNAETFHAGGWFRTGDIGRLDPSDGCLTLTGRAKDVIITGGLNVYPREVELVLDRVAGVARVAVVGAPSDRWGEEVVAFVVADPQVSAENLINAAREQLSAYKCPKRVLFVDALPTNAMGKIQRDVLASQAAQAR